MHEEPGKDRMANMFWIPTNWDVKGAIETTEILT